MLRRSAARSRVPVRRSEALKNRMLGRCVHESCGSSTRGMLSERWDPGDRHRGWSDHRILRNPSPWLRINVNVRTSKISVPRRFFIVDGNVVFDEIVVSSDF